jgi:hypothetical protein
MTVKVAINGFGRIGRNVLRAIYRIRPHRYRGRGDQRSRPGRNQRPPDALRQVHGRSPATVDGRRRHHRSRAATDQGDRERDPKNLPWGDLGIDIVMECTGIFTARKRRDPPGSRRQARAGLGSGLRRRQDHRLRRQPRRADQGRPRRLQRVLHHQLPGAGRPCPERRPSASRRAS